MIIITIVMEKNGIKSLLSNGYLNVPPITKWPWQGRM